MIFAIAFDTQKDGNGKHCKDATENKLTQGAHQSRARNQAETHSGFKRIEPTFKECCEA